MLDLDKDVIFLLGVINIFILFSSFIDGFVGWFLRCRLSFFCFFGHLRIFCLSLDLENCRGLFFVFGLLPFVHLVRGSSFGITHLCLFVFLLLLRFFGGHYSIDSVLGLIVTLLIEISPAGIRISICSFGLIFIPVIYFDFVLMTIIVILLYFFWEAPTSRKSA